MLTTLAAFFAVALFSGCDDDKGSEPDPQPVKLASPGIVFKDVKPTSFAASWTAVEHAAAFGYKLLATDGDSETVVAEVASYDAVEVSFSGLKPATEYTLEVVALAGDAPGYTDSDENIDGIAKFAAECHFPTMNILPYHKLGVTKHERLGSTYLLPDVQPPSDARMRELADIIESHGVKCIIN